MAALREAAAAADAQLAEVTQQLAARRAQETQAVAAMVPLGASLSGLETASNTWANSLSGASARVA